MPRATVEQESWEARWDGHCFECEQAIHRGQKVTRVDGRVAHLTCPTDRPVEVCTKCWLVRPCEHDEGA